MFKLVSLFVVLMIATSISYSAERSYSAAAPKLHVNGSPITLTWALLASGDTGAPVQAGYALNISFQTLGTFSSGTIVLEGSNDGTTYYTLKDVGGSNVSNTSAAFATVRDRPRWIRPKVSVGTASTDLTGVLYLSN